MEDPPQLRDHEVIDDDEPTIEERLDAAVERIAALERNSSDRAEGETRKHDFIRAAAIALLHRLPLPPSPTTVWAMARELWDSKPEDC